MQLTSNEKLICRPATRQQWQSGRSQLPFQVCISKSNIELETIPGCNRRDVIYVCNLIYDWRQPSRYRLRRVTFEDPVILLDGRHFLANSDHLFYTHANVCGFRSLLRTAFKIAEMQCQNRWWMSSTACCTCYFPIYSRPQHRDST